MINLAKTIHQIDLELPSVVNKLNILYYLIKNYEMDKRVVLDFAIFASVVYNFKGVWIYTIS